MVKRHVRLCAMTLSFALALTATVVAGEPTFTNPDHLVLHVVSPRATDPAIDQALDDHYVWLDPTAATHHKLFVFMPGTAVPPAAYQLVQQEAARLGYHVIGLMYPNGVAIRIPCAATSDSDACFESARLEILD